MALIRMPRLAQRVTFPRQTPLPPLEQRLRQFFDEPLSIFNAEPQLTGLLPATDVVENDRELILTSELPGMTRKDVTVSVDDGVLTVKGEKSEERKEGDEQKDYRVVEREYGAFQRAFTLPRTVDGTKITATMKDGILTVRLPKLPEAKTNGRTIEIAG